jgi:hypothetical protein
MMVAREAGARLASHVCTETLGSLAVDLPLIGLLRLLYTLTRYAAVYMLLHIF